MEKQKETLFSLAAATRNAIEGRFTIDENTGEIFWSPDDLDALDLALSDKAGAVIAVQQEYATKAEAVDAQVKRMVKLRDGYRRQAARLKEYLGTCVDAAGKPIETEYGKVSLRHSQAVEILDVSAIPEMYMRVKDPVPDKTLIKAALKQDAESVPGAALVVNVSVQVR